MSVVFFSLRSLVKRNLSLLLVALFVIVAASALHAQIVETGIITGVVKDTTGALGCVPLASPPLARFDACSDDKSCPAGTWCNLLTAVCSPFCTSSATCGEGACIPAVDGNDTPIPGVKVCTAHCDPVQATPCGTGATCTYDPNDGQFDCAMSGFAPEGMSCQQASDCGRGLGCAVDAANQGSCLAWCEPTDTFAGICGGLYCNSFSNSSSITYDGTTYGYCQ